MGMGILRLLLPTLLPHPAKASVPHVGVRHFLHVVQHIGMDGVAEVVPRSNSEGVPFVFDCSSVNTSELITYHSKEKTSKYSSSLVL